MKYVSFAAIAMALLLISPIAHASTKPTLALSNSGNDVLLRVKGDPRVKVVLFYTNSSDVQKSKSLGTTDSEGTFSSTLDRDDYSVGGDGRVYVQLNGTSGPYSSTIVWPEENVNYDDIKLALDAITVGKGATSVVPIEQGTTDKMTLSKNSNTSVADASLNGSQILITGKSAGTTILTVCYTTGSSSCKTVAVTVQDSAASQSFAFVRANPVIAVGDSATVTISGSISGHLYLSSNQNPDVVQATLISNALTLHGYKIGKSNVSACSTNGGCTSLMVSVVDEDSDALDGEPTLSRSSLSLTAGNTSTVSITGNDSYSVTKNSSSRVASATIVQSSQLIVTALTPGNTTITVCNNDDDCDTLAVTVTAAPVTLTTTGTSTTTSSVTPAAYNFTKYLETGSENTDVMALQLTLKILGFFTVTPNGYFGPATKAAVLAFQKAHGIDQLGIVGPATRAALNTNK